MNTTITKLDIMDWCMVIEIIVLLGISVFYAHRYENAPILSGVGIGVVIGALAAMVAESVRTY